MAKKKPPRRRTTAAILPAAETARMAVTSTATRLKPHKPDKPPKPPKALREEGIKVRATRVGYYDNARRRLGDVFVIAEESEFSRHWMERVHPDTPEKVTTPNESIRQQHDEILAMRHGGQVPPGSIQTGPDNVPDDLPTGTANPLGEE